MTINPDAERLSALSEAKIETRTLQEILKIDFDLLLCALAPDMPKPDFGDSGILAKMSLSGAQLYDYFGPTGLRDFITHKSDTVRGLSAYGLAHGMSGASVDQILSEIRPFARDPHFGVREWAWLCVRPLLVRDLDTAIAALSEWTQETDLRLRRFAVEVLRPRGVWCKHIPRLRETPGLGLPLLEPMRTETEKYPQDSVANWLNDAAKDHPKWVLALCADWRNAETGNKNTERIVARATRSIKPEMK